jgi:hypothetical protein
MFLFAWAFLGVASAVQAAPALSALSGNVFIMKAGTRVWKPVGAGHALAAGDQVRTVAGASATIAFDDGSRINLGANGAFTLQESTADGTFLRLSLGSLRAWVNKALSRRFAVRTPTAVCSVRGTEFSVEVNAQGHTSVQMFSGILAVADQRGNETLIRDRESLRVTERGFSAVEHRRGAGMMTAARERLKDLAKREVRFEMSKEAGQSAMAMGAMNEVYKEGKALIDINGNRVRLEEFIVRPSPDEFKLVVLNHSVAGSDYFYYHGLFNTTLPGDLSIALRELPGCIGSACQYYLTGYDTGRSNGIDNMLEVASGGHPIDVNNDGNAADAVTSAFNPLMNQFISLRVPNAGGSGNQSYFQTLFDYDKLTFDGVPHGGWVPAGGVTPYDGTLGTGVQNYGAQINSGAVAIDMGNPTAGSYSPSSLTTLQNPPACAPPNCTYNDAGLEHQVVYAANGDGSVWEMYDNYIISDAGKVATTAAFTGLTSGSAYEQTLLHWNFETIVTASEFNGRSINLVVEPKIMIESGLIQ